MRRSILLAVVLPFVSAFLGAALAFSLLAPPPATAQSNQPQELRASAFTLVGLDGTVIARLGPGGGGAGNLTLFNEAGTPRVGLTGGGALNVFGDDGTTIVFRAGLANASANGSTPVVNGVLLGPGGSISTLPSQ